jgi:hypothetical protein
MKFAVMMFFVALVATKPTCNKKAKTGCYKGKLEIKGICSNYTIKLLEGNLDTSQIAANWTDEHTGKSYTNVFALGSPCTFPDSIKEGDEFYFIVDTARQDCNVCMAYYPIPGKKLPIKVVPLCK